MLLMHAAKQVSTYLSIMDFTHLEVTLVLFLVVVLAIFAFYFFQTQRIMKKLRQTPPRNVEADKLKIAAYERLTLFAERNKIDNLINRFYQPGLDTQTMRQLMLQSIREEFDHNVTQQLYVKAPIWDAVSKIKEQNMFIINQVAAMLPGDAPAMEFNKQLIQLIHQNENTTMNKVVLEALQFEVQQLMN